MTGQARQVFQHLLADSIVEVDAAAAADKFPTLRYGPTDSGEQALTNLLNLGQPYLKEIGGGTSAAAPSLRTLQHGLPKIGFVENLSGADLVDGMAAPAAAVERGVPDVIANVAPVEANVGRGLPDTINGAWSPANLAAREEREAALAALYRPGAPIKS